jgi:hypothetical protein
MQAYSCIIAVFSSFVIVFTSLLFARTQDRAGEDRNSVYSLFRVTGMSKGQYSTRCLRCKGKFIKRGGKAMDIGGETIEKPWGMMEKA